MGRQTLKLNTLRNTDAPWVPTTGSPQEYPLIQGVIPPASYLRFQELVVGLGQAVELQPPEVKRMLAAIDGARIEGSTWQLDTLPGIADRAQGAVKAVLNSAQKLDGEIAAQAQAEATASEDNQAEATASEDNQAEVAAASAALKERVKKTLDKMRSLLTPFYGPSVVDDVTDTQIQLDDLSIQAALERSLRLAEHAGTISLILNLGVASDIKRSQEMRNALLGALLKPETLGGDLQWLLGIFDFDSPLGAQHLYRQAYSDCHHLSAFCAEKQKNKSDDFPSDDGYFYGTDAEPIALQQQKPLFRQLIRALINDPNGLMRCINLLTVLAGNAAGQNLRDLQDDLVALLGNGTKEQAFLKLALSFYSLNTHDCRREFGGMKLELLTSRAVVHGIPVMARRSSQAQVAIQYLNALNNRKEKTLPTDKELAVLCGPDVVKSLLAAVVEDKTFANALLRVLPQNKLVETAILRHAFQSQDAAGFWTDFFARYSADPQTDQDGQALPSERQQALERLDAWMGALFELEGTYGVLAHAMSRFWNVNKNLFIQDEAAQAQAQAMTAIATAFKDLSIADRIPAAAKTLIETEFPRWAMVRNETVGALFKRLNVVRGEESPSKSERHNVYRKQRVAVSRAASALLAERFAEKHPQVVGAWLPQLDQLLAEDMQIVVGLVLSAPDEDVVQEQTGVSRKTLIADTVVAHLAKEAHVPYVAQMIENGQLMQVWGQGIDGTTLGNLLLSSKGFKRNFKQVMKERPELLDGLVVQAASSRSSEDAATQLLGAVYRDMNIQLNIGTWLDKSGVKMFGKSPLTRTALLSSTSGALGDILSGASSREEENGGGESVPSEASPEDRSKMLARAYQKALAARLLPDQRLHVIQTLRALMDGNVDFATAALQQSRVRQLLFSGPEGMKRLNDWLAIRVSNDAAAGEEPKWVLTGKHAHFDNPGFEEAFFGITLFRRNLAQKLAGSSPGRMTRMKAYLAARIAELAPQADPREDSGSPLELTQVQYAVREHRERLQRTQERLKAGWTPGRMLSDLFMWLFAGWGRWKLNLNRKAEANARAHNQRRLQLSASKKENGDGMVMTPNPAPRSGLPNGPEAGPLATDVYDIRETGVDGAGPGSGWREPTDGPYLVEGSGDEAGAVSAPAAPVPVPRPVGDPVVDTSAAAGAWPTPSGSTRSRVTGQAVLVAGDGANGLANLAGLAGQVAARGAHQGPEAPTSTSFADYVAGGGADESSVLPDQLDRSGDEGDGTLLSQLGTTFDSRDGTLPSQLFDSHLGGSVVGASTSQDEQGADQPQLRSEYMNVSAGPTGSQGGQQGVEARPNQGPASAARGSSGAAFGTFGAHSAGSPSAQQRGARAGQAPGSDPGPNSDPKAGVTRLRPAGSQESEV